MDTLIVNILISVLEMANLHCQKLTTNSSVLPASIRS